MGEQPQTWHHGLMARWWAEFNTAQPEEVAYYRNAIKRFGQPALDLACGAGRILVSLLASGVDVDGVDISADMLSQAARLAAGRGLAPTLHRQAMHELDLPRRYGTVYICDSFGIGATREQDREALRRVLAHLEPGGGLVFSHDLPYAGVEAGEWARWLPGRRGTFPREWPNKGRRRPTSDGDEIELLIRAADFDPLQQCETLETRLKLWSNGSVIREEEHRIRLNLYFAQELLLMLEVAGFSDVTIEGFYTSRPATPDDARVLFVARRPT